jgi:Ca2+-binding RTX toxin-like protein
MTVYTITPATSIFSNGTVAFQSGSAAADTLNVQTGAHVFAGGPVGTGKTAIWLKGPGAWTASINGSVYSTEAIGLLLNASLPLSAISIGTDGSIGGAYAAIEARSPVTITNRGELLLSPTELGAATLRFFGAGEHRVTNYGLIDAGYNKAIYDVGNVGTEIIDNRGTINGNLVLGGGNDRVTNTGSTKSSALDMGAGNNSITNSGTITGQTDIHISFGNGNDTLTNTGLIYDDDGNGIGGTVDFGAGINVLNNNLGGNYVLSTQFGGGADTITNKGTMWGDFTLGGGRNIFTNNGKFTGYSVTGGIGNDSVRNTGTWSYLYPTLDFAEIFLGNGLNDVVNSGVMDANVTGGAGADVFTNSGTYTGNITLGGGADVFNNTGQVTGFIQMGSDDFATERLTNTGTINGSVNLGKGNDIVVNTGTINGSIFAGGGVHSITNSGTINGSYFGGATSTVSSNTFTNYIITGTVKKSGVVTGPIYLGSSADVFRGGEKAETVYDFLGADNYNFGGGNDTYGAFYRSDIRGTDAVDMVDGGTGSDTYILSDSATEQTVLNIDTVQHRYGPGFFDPNGNITAANTAMWNGLLSERVFNFENVTGNDASNVIYGNAAANIMLGNGGIDVLHGYGGNDTLDGGADVDLLVGGLGRDVLTGGADTDYFIFTSVADSILGAGRDVITDFNPLEGDFITLDAIDANTIAAGNNAFTSFIGINVAFAANTPGTLRAIFTPTGWIVEGNTDNDAAAEFQIAVNDSLHTISWNSGLFIL